MIFPIFLGPAAISIALGVASLFMVTSVPSVVAFDVLFGYNTSEYWQLPPLHAYDSFESCLHNRPHGVFCVTKVVIKPDSRSETWRLIKKYSQYIFQYTHDVLTRGVCVEKCSKLVEWLEESGVPSERYYVPMFNVSKRTKYL